MGVKLMIFLYHNQIFDFIIEKSDYDIKILIMIQNALGPWVFSSLKLDSGHLGRVNMSHWLVSHCRLQCSVLMYNAIIGP